MGPAPLGLRPLRWVGASLAAAGGAVLVDSFARFALRGLGTPAPVVPPTRLVVSGLYRHVRNPMYLAIVGLVLGHALLLGDSWVAAWGALLWAGFHLFAVRHEEPGLLRRFGPPYDAYRRNCRAGFPGRGRGEEGRRGRVAPDRPRG